MPVLPRLTEAPDIDGCLAHRSLVFGMRRRGRLVGGVVMTGEPPLRTLMRVPQAERAAVAAAFDDADTVELSRKISANRHAEV